MQIFLKISIGPLWIRSARTAPYAGWFELRYAAPERISYLNGQLQRSFRVGMPLPHVALRLYGACIRNDRVSTVIEFVDDDRPRFRISSPHSYIAGYRVVDNGNDIELLIDALDVRSENFGNKDPQSFPTRIPAR